MSEIDVTLTFIKRLKEMGCRFALDDFGAGFSSFYYLKRFDVDYLKIDGSFIRDLATDEGSRIFVRALNDVAHGLDKQVIAEWVETPEVLKLLLGMGTQFGQGYLFQRPAPLAELGAQAEPRARRQRRLSRRRMRKQTSAPRFASSSSLDVRNLSAHSRPMTVFSSVILPVPHPAPAPRRGAPSPPPGTRPSSGAWPTWVRSRAR